MLTLILGYMKRKLIFLTILMAIMVNIAIYAVWHLWVSVNWLRITFAVVEIALLCALILVVLLFPSREQKLKKRHEEKWKERHRISSS